MADRAAEKLLAGRSMHDALQREFDGIHEAGVARHPQTWFSANRAAVEVIWRIGERAEDLKMKVLVSGVVLKTLDVAGVK